MGEGLHLKCHCLCEEAKQAARIAAERVGEVVGCGNVELRLTLAECETEGYVLEVAGPLEARIGAKRRRDFIERSK